MDAKQSEVVRGNGTEGRFGGWGTRKCISNTHVHAKAHGSFETDVQKGFGAPGGSHMYVGGG